MASVFTTTPECKKMIERIDYLLDIHGSRKVKSFSMYVSLLEIRIILHRYLQKMKHSIVANEEALDDTVVQINHALECIEEDIDNDEELAINEDYLKTLKLKAVTLTGASLQS